MRINLSKFTSCNPDTSLIEEICLTNMTEHHVLPALTDLVINDKRHKKFDIKHFSVKHCHLDENEYEALYSLLANCNHLENINLSENHIDVFHAKHILNSLPHENLKSLTFVDNWVGENEADKHKNIRHR